MNKEQMTALLEDIQQGRLSVEQGLDRLKKMPFEDLGFVKIDHHRALRSGFPEVVFCQGKTIEQVERIVRAMREHGTNLLLTRAEPELAERMRAIDPRLVYHEASRTLVLRQCEAPAVGRVLVISGGTADIPVAEEAAITAEVSGSRVDRLFDVGVAGLHRLAAHIDLLHAARCIIAVAGMEGALPSVAAGMATCPVIAVPTSVGYGSHLGGLAPMLTMLNSCAPAVTVVNIDNGFGAGFVASMINRLPGPEAAGT